jgi:hypothetical protein
MSEARQLSESTDHAIDPLLGKTPMPEFIETDPAGSILRPAGQPTEEFTADTMPAIGDLAAMRAKVAARESTAEADDEAARSARDTKAFKGGFRAASIHDGAGDNAEAKGMERPKRPLHARATRKIMEWAVGKDSGIVDRSDKVFAAMNKQPAYKPREFNPLLPSITNAELAGFRKGRIAARKQAKDREMRQSFGVLNGHRGPRR